MSPAAGLFGDWDRAINGLSQQAAKRYDQHLGMTTLKAGHVIRNNIVKGMANRGRFRKPFTGDSAPGVPRAKTPYAPLTFFGFMSRKSSKSQSRKAAKAKTSGARGKAYQKLGGMFSSAKPLLDTGELWRSVSVSRRGRAGVFVGVKRNFKRGSRSANLARIHEYGAVARLPGGRGTRIIPARPFIRPGFKDAEDEVKKLFKEAHREAIFSMFGG